MLTAVTAVHHAHTHTLTHKIPAVIILYAFALSPHSYIANTHVCYVFYSLQFWLRLLFLYHIFFSLINFRWFRLAYSVFFFIVLEAGKLQKKTEA